MAGQPVSTTRDPFAGDGVERLLTDAQVDAIASWLRRQADRLGLRDWVVRVSPYPAGRDSTAASHLLDNAEVAVVAVSSGWLRATPEDQATTLTHELLHCHVQPITRMAEKLVEGELGSRTEALFVAALAQVEERCIDRLAHGLAPLLEPLDLAVARCAYPGCAAPTDRLDGPHDRDAERPWTPDAHPWHEARP